MNHQRTFVMAARCAGLCLLMLAAAMGRLNAQTVPAASNAPPAITNTAPTSDESAEAYKKMSLEELMNQDVTSVSKEPEPYGQAPASIDVITQDEIRRSGATSIPEALRLADNLEVAQKDSHDWAISARGFDTALANKLLVLMDGRTVYTPLFSGVIWDVQDYLLEDLDRIEVISGPGGTLWGANAVNGVINITSKSAKDTQGLYVEGGGGNELRDFGGLRYGGTLTSNVYFRIYGKYFDRGNEVYPNDTPASDSWQSGQGGFRLDADASPHDLLTLQGDAYAGNENAETGDEAKTAGDNVLGRWSHTISDESDFSLQMYYDQTHFVDPVTSAFAPTGFLTDDLRTYDLDFKDHFPLGSRNAVTWGLGYRYTHDVVEDAPGLSFVPSVLDQNLYNVFVQDVIKLSDQLFFTLGTKVEHNDYTGFEYEPSGRLQYNATSNQMYWAAISRAVRTPSRVDRDEVSPSPALEVLIGGSNFISETVIAYELGYRAQLSSKVSGSLSTFFNQYDNVRSVSATPGTIIPLYFTNNLQGYTYGLELGANYQVLDCWRLHAGYDLLEEHLGIKPGQMDVNNAMNETADPKNQFQIRSSLDLPERVEVDTALRWVDTLHINNGATVGTVPSYCELEARIGWRPTTRVELSVVGQNLLHDHHPEYGFPSTTRVEIGRSVYGKVAYRW